MSTDVHTTLTSILSETHTFPHGRLPSDLIKTIAISIAQFLQSNETGHGGISLDAISIDEQGAISLNCLPPSLLYFSPERRDLGPSGPPSPADDIWALGCLLLQLVENRSDNLLPPAFPLATYAKALSSEGVEFLSWLLQADPTRRPTAADLCHSPFLQNKQSFFAQKFRRKPIGLKEKKTPNTAHPNDSGSLYSHSTSVPSTTSSQTLSLSSAGARYEATPQRAFRALYKATHAAQAQRNGAVPGTAPKRGHSEPRSEPPRDVQHDPQRTDDGNGWSICQSVVASCENLIQQLGTRSAISDVPQPSGPPSAAKRSLSAASRGSSILKASDDIYGISTVKDQSIPATDSKAPSSTRDKPLKHPSVPSQPRPPSMPSSPMKEGYPNFPATPKAASVVAPDSAAASAKRIRHWLNHLSGHLISPVAVSAASSLAPATVSEMDLSRHSPSVFHPTAAKDEPQTTLTESLLSQTVSQGLSMQDFINNIEQRIGIQQAPVPISQDLDLHANYSAFKARKLAEDVPNNPPTEHGKPNKQESTPVGKQVNSHPAASHSSSPTVQDVVELLNGSAYLRSLGVSLGEASPPGSAQKAQIFLTAAGAQCAMRNEVPSPDSSTTVVVESLQSLRSALQGFDMLDLQQAIMNLDFSVPEPAPPTPYVLNVNLSAPPPYKAPTPAKISSSSWMYTTASPQRRPHPIDQPMPKVVESFPVPTFPTERDITVSSVAEYEPSVPPTPLTRPALYQPSPSSSHAAALQHSPPEIDPNGTLEFPRNQVPPEPVPMVQPGNDFFGQSSSQHQRQDDVSAHQLLSAPNSETSPAEVFRNPSPDVWNAQAEHGVPMSPNLATVVWVPPTIPNFASPQHAPSPTGHGHSFRHSSDNKVTPAKSTTATMWDRQISQQTPNGEPLHSAKRGPVSTPQSPPTPATAALGPSPVGSCPPASRLVDTSVQCLMSFDDSSPLLDRPKRRSRRRSFSSPAPVADAATSPVALPHGNPEIAELRERQHFLMQLTSQLQQQLLLVTTTTNMRFAAHDSEMRKTNSECSGSYSGAQYGSRKPFRTTEVEEPSPYGTETYEHHHHHHIINCDGANPAECFIPPTLGMANSAHSVPDSHSQGTTAFRVGMQPIPSTTLATMTGVNLHRGMPQAPGSSPKYGLVSPIMEEDAKNVAWGESPPTNLALSRPLRSPETGETMDRTDPSSHSGSRSGTATEPTQEEDVIRTLQQHYRLHDTTGCSQYTDQVDMSAGSVLSRTASSVQGASGLSATPQSGRRSAASQRAAANGSQRSDTQRSAQWPVDSTLHDTQITTPQSLDALSPNINIEEARRQLRYSDSSARKLSAQPGDLFDGMTPSSQSSDLLRGTGNHGRPMKQGPSLTAGLAPRHPPARKKVLKDSGCDEDLLLASDSSIFWASGEDLSATTDTCSSCLRALSDELSTVDGEGDLLQTAACGSCCTEVLAKMLEESDKTTFQRNAQRRLAKTFRNQPLAL